MARALRNSTMPLELEPVAIGTQIRNSSPGSAAGAIGAFLSRKGDDHLYALTASHILGAVREGPMVFSSTGLAFAETIECKSAKGKTGLSSIASALGVARIDLAIQVIARRPASPERVVTGKPTALLGKKVLKIGGNGTAATVGRVEATNSPLHLRHPVTGEVKDFLGAIEIVNDVEQTEFAVPRDAGLPVHTENDELIGLIVGVIPGRCFVAPVTEFLAQQSFELASPQRLGRHARSPHSAGEGGKKQPAPIYALVDMGAWTVFNQFVDDIPKNPTVYKNTLAGAGRG